MKMFLVTLAAFALVSTSAVAGKAVLKEFSFARGSITFYKDGKYESRKGTERRAGEWEYIGTNVVCPKTGYEKSYCKRHYRL